MPSAKPLTSLNISSAQVLVLGAGTTLGIVVQALGLIPALRGVGFRWKWRFDFRKLALRELGRASGWMLVYVLVTQVGAGHHADPDHGREPQATCGRLVTPRHHGLQLLLPDLHDGARHRGRLDHDSTHAAPVRRRGQGRFGDLASLLAMGTRLSAVILIPATAAYITLGQPLAVTVFQWHSYTHQDAMQYRHGHRGRGDRTGPVRDQPDADVRLLRDAATRRRRR